MITIGKIRRYINSFAVLPSIFIDVFRVSEHVDITFEWLIWNFKVRIERR